MKQRLDYIKTSGINRQFKKINTKDRKKLSEWLIRQYFDPKLHAKTVWYKQGVKVSSVLLYVSDPLNRFPLTPAKITDMYKCIQSFKKSLKKSEKELGPDFGLSKKDVQALDNRPKYQTGEVTLKEIGQCLGGLTPTMINKLGTSGFEKIRKLTSGVPLYDIQGDKLERFIMDCRVNAALEYADGLMNSKGQIKTFIGELVKKRIMTVNDVKIMRDKEVESLMLLSAKSQGEIVHILMSDISRDSNVFKSYQSAVSRLAFPEKKRGRPRKNPEDLL